MNASNINDITQNARLQVRTGLYSQEEILQQLIQSLWNQQLEEEATCPINPPTSKSLKIAFSRLETEDRIICRMNFTCCRTCGNTEIRGEANETHIGYCFFHEQDTEGAVGGTGLLFRYGDFRDDSTDESMVYIGRKIAARLREEGLTVDWDENPKKTIELDPFQWRVRLSRSSSDVHSGYRCDSQRDCDHWA